MMGSIVCSSCAQQRLLGLALCYDWLICRSHLLRLVISYNEASSHFANFHGRVKGIVTSKKLVRRSSRPNPKTIALA